MRIWKSVACIAHPPCQLLSLERAGRNFRFKLERNKYNAAHSTDNRYGCAETCILPHSGPTLVLAVSPPLGLGRLRNAFNAMHDIRWVDYHAIMIGIDNSGVDLIKLASKCNFQVIGEARELKQPPIEVPK